MPVLTDSPPQEWVADLEFERIGPLRRALKRYLIHPFGNYFPAAAIRTALRVLRSELAHAYHHQVLGYDQPDIKAAFQRAVEGKSYESVLRFDGHHGRHYALNNDQEYFAETTEAYFATNDFYPFVRAELGEHDPEMAKVLRKVWIERWKTPEAAKP